MRPGVLWRRFLAWGTETEGSTRSAALVRIGLVLLIWSRWAGESLLFDHQSTHGVLFVLAFFTTTTLMLLGVASRLSVPATAAVTLAMYYHVGHRLGHEPWTHHHTYLLAFATLLLGLTPCGRSYSVDRWLALRRAERRGEPPPPERGNLLGLRLIAFQLSLIYLWSACDKTHLGYLSGDRLQHIFQRYYAGSDPSPWPWPGVLWAPLAWGTVALEYALGVGLLVRRTRRWLVVPGLLFHAALYVLLPIRTYSATMALLYLAYFDADTVHEVIERLEGGRARQ